MTTGTGARWNASVGLALVGAGIVLLTLPAPALHHKFGSSVFVPLTIVCGAAAALALQLAARADERQALWIVLIGAAVMRLSMIWVDNYFSSDIFRYIWDGRAQAAGINPYRYVPAAPELSFLRDSNIHPHINRADWAVTIYPPAAQMVFLFVTRFGESVLVMKAGLLVFDAVTIASLIAILRRLGRPPACVVAYAWHPLPIWEIAVNGHLDSVMVALLMLALWLALRGQNLLAGVLATIGALVKPTALLALPAFWGPWNWRLPLAAAATIALFYLPYLSVGWGALGFLPDYAREEGISTGTGFWFLSAVQHITGPLAGGKWLYLSASAIILATLALRAGFRTDRTPEATIRAMAWMMFAFLFLLSPDYPWYFLALVPFLALTPLVAPWILSSGAFILYDVIDNDTVLHFATRESLLYGATLIALAYDLWSGRAKGATYIPGDVRA